MQQQKRNKVNEDNSLTHFTFSVLFIFYKREEVEIRHEPSWYDKEQLPSLTSTQLVFFGEIQVQNICGPLVTNKVNEHNIRFPRDEEGNVDVKNCQLLIREFVGIHNVVTNVMRANNLPRLFCLFCGSGFLSHCLGLIFL